MTVLTNTDTTGGAEINYESTDDDALMTTGIKQVKWHKLCLARQHRVK